jgi:hypothetical protein
MLLGSFAAVGQRNIKRLMAYSSIGHVGYALMGLAVDTEIGVRGVLVYMAIYLVMNIGTFAVLVSMRRQGKAVELIEAEDYDRVVVWRNGHVESIPLKPIIKIIKKCHQANICAFPVDPHGFMVKTARSLGIYLGQADDELIVPSLVPQSVPLVF